MFTPDPPYWLTLRPDARGKQGAPTLYFADVRISTRMSPPRMMTSSGLGINRIFRSRTQIRATMTIKLTSKGRLSGRTTMATLLVATVSYTEQGGEGIGGGS